MQIKTIIGIISIIASSLVGVTAAAEKDGVVENDMSSVAVDTTSNLRGRRITTSPWITSVEAGVYLYDKISLDQSIDGGKLTGSVWYATPIAGGDEVLPFVSEANFQYDFGNPLLASATISYAPSTDYASSQVFTLISGDKTMKVIVMNSKIKKIVINGEEVPARAVKPIRKLNQGLASIDTALNAVYVSLTGYELLPTVFGALVIGVSQLQDILVL